MGRSLVRVVAVLIPLVATWPAQADDPAVEQAKAHFASAQQHFKLGRFDEALAEYTKAFEAKALPAFLFNIGQCHRKLEHFNKAVFFYQSYLRDAPDAPNRDQVVSLISKCEQKHEKQEAKREAEEKARREAEEQARIAAEMERARIETERARIEAERAALVKPPDDPGKGPEAPPVYKKWWFWTIIGGVAAAAIAGGVAGGLAANEGGTRTVLPAGTAGTIDGRTHL